MVLTEKHKIRYSKETRDLCDAIDDWCFRCKNLFNSVNYLISQCRHISYCLQTGKELTDEQKEILSNVNKGIEQYNMKSNAKYKIKRISETNGFLANSFFLNWYMKTADVYKSMPYATCSQICIRELCRDWKSFYHSLKDYQKHPQKYTGRPRKPHYKDKQYGRKALVITYQNFNVNEDGTISFPEFLKKKNLNIKTDKTNICQIRITVKEGKRSVYVQIMYKKEEPDLKTNPSRVMALDLGVNNLIAAVSNTGMDPFLISGKPLKAMNQYYNKKMSKLRSIAEKENKMTNTRRMWYLTDKRNNQVLDYMHKASRKLIDFALENRIDKIIIGKNRFWKQNISKNNNEVSAETKKKNNQNFVSIPHAKLIKLIEYKAALKGIAVVLPEESYTSGTSALDHESPTKKYYNKDRRIHRGLFISNTGEKINADVNAAYQIMKKDSSVVIETVPFKTVKRINVVVGPKKHKKVY